jgi:hypothetical protein
LKNSIDRKRKGEREGEREKIKYNKKIARIIKIEHNLSLKA